MVSRIGDVSQVGKREFATGGMASSFYSVESRRVKIREFPGRSKEAVSGLGVGKWAEVIG